MFVVYLEKERAALVWVFVVGFVVAVVVCLCLGFFWVFLREMFAIIVYFVSAKPQRLSR